YDYGHNLSPDAPIKVPWMTYVPPIIGTKTLLTIKASSYPSWGTLFMMLALAAAVTALVLRIRRPEAGSQTAQAAPAPRPFSAAAAIIALVAVTACGQAAGDDRGTRLEAAPDFAAGGTCAYCGGEIPAERFGGEVTTRSGETYRFMSVECLAGFIAAGSIPRADIRGMRVVDYSDGERLIDAQSALYVRSDQRRSPNGLNLLASDSEKIAHNLHFFFGGERMTWPQVLDYVRREWSL
ncbi:MAG TPA: hypothetical protein VK936_00175, partial [Longimicrobiales bacterium]|nr:hypothetical protein [Longimicrobiales bacterium]